MRYISTRGQTDPMSFKEALLTGLAPDGGLLLPQHIPGVGGLLTHLESCSYVDLAFEIVSLFVDDIPPDDLQALVQASYTGFDTDDVVELRSVGDYTVLELFHGPTLAFKDIALQLLGRLFEYTLAEQGRHLNILGATSGDTGSAAIAGVRGQPNIDIFVMYPNGRVSDLQELQMTTVADPNVHCLAVDGSFDDCQSLMKALFADLDTKARLSLGAVNSVNWARVLAQVVYYGYTSMKLARDGAPVSFAVPTGNFGDIFAGYVAKCMGFPIGHLILATNENDILAEFIRTGRYRRGDVHHTLAPAMDIQVASNFERFLYYHLDSDPDRLCAFMAEFADTGQAALDAPPENTPFLATAIDTDTMLATIRNTYEQHGYLADPHTAVGIAACDEFVGDAPMVCVATAHPAKFPEAIAKALPSVTAEHPRLTALLDLPTRREVIAADRTVVRDYIEQHKSA